MFLAIQLKSNPEKIGIAFLVKYGNVGNEIFEEIYYFCEQTEAGDFLAAIGIHDSEGVKNFT